ncbi:MAG: methyltransferase domain-containing protein [Anaerolineae bacterium]|nr:methyltransferase domain-containing protein [Anaerolineae bacterium]
MDQGEYYISMQTQTGWTTILESFARFVAPPAGSRVLDVGTGPGALVKMFREQYQAEAFGVDDDPLLMAHALDYQAIGDLFVCGSVYQLPFQTNQFDVVTATNVLYLLEEVPSALQEMVRVLKSGGTFVMLNPSPQMTIASATALADERGLTGFARENFIHWGEIAEAKVRWSPKQIAELFQKVGLQLTETRERVGVGLALYARGMKRGG